MDYTHQLITTFGGALFFGITFIVISNKLKISPIVLLLLGGIAVGPFGLKLIDPAHLGEGLKAVIQLSVALILFEGGLTLDIKGYRKVSTEIRSVLSIGVITTWFFSALIIKCLFDFPWSFSILSGSLIIVTGPTVIVPLLKRIRVHKNIHSFLHWEGVLIDPIGVFIALLCFEWFIGDNAVALFFFRIFTGLGIGVVSSFIMAFLIKKNWISDEILNVFILSFALALYIVSDLIVPESGLMSVVVAGFAVGYMETPQIDSLKMYNTQLIELLIGLLFILLAANLDLESFSKHYGIRMVITVVAVMVIIRPLNILVSTFWKKNLNIREKLFLCWIAPRGIVAASMASLFTLKLNESGQSHYAINYDFLEAFTYAVICGTVIFQGFTAQWIGRLLKVLQPVPTGWVIIGAHTLGRTIGSFIQHHGFAVSLIDTNIHSVKVAKRDGLSAISGNALTINPDDFPELYGVGNVLAITENEDLNELVCRRFEKKLNKPFLYQWRDLSDDESVKEVESFAGRPIWTKTKFDKMIFANVSEQNIHMTKENVIADQIDHPERILMYYGNDRILPYVPDNTKEKCTCLIYQPFDITLELNIKPNWIIISDSTSMSSVLKELLGNIKNDYPQIPVDQLHKKLMELEKEYSSVIGYKIALSHTYTDGIDDSLILFAKLKKEVPCTFGSDKVEFVFLVLSPKDQPNTHISTLAKISKFIVSDNNRKDLNDASSREELIDVFFKKLHF